MKDLEDRIAQIEERNRRVELDKAWETSGTRRASIALCTYGIVVGFLHVINNPDPLTNALVPVAGYLLSTLALRTLRSAWELSRSKHSE